MTYKDRPIRDLFWKATCIGIKTRTERLSPRYPDMVDVTMWDELNRKLHILQRISPFVGEPGEGDEE